MALEHGDGELSMVSSAVYRYFASHDELLTALIIDAYHSLEALREQVDLDVADDVVTLTLFRVAVETTGRAIGL